MELRRLGNSDLLVSVVGLGTNNFGLRDDVAAGPVVAKALDLGVNYFDTAESYGSGKSEEALGAALAGRRHEAVIASKWGTTRNPPPGMGSRSYILKACDASLKRLRTDYIDLYHLHKTDPDTPIEETILACDELVQQGKIRHYGLSGSAAWRMVEAQLTAKLLGKAGFVATQDHYSLLRRDVVEGDALAVMQNYAISLVPFFPLAGGLLTGKYRRGEPFPEGSRFAVLKQLGSPFTSDRMFTLAEELTAFAEARGRTILELAMSWLVQRPMVASVVAGATSAAQVEANVAAAEWNLTTKDMQEVDRITAG